MMIPNQNQSKFNKGISTPIGILIIVVFALVVGGVSYGYFLKTKVEIPEVKVPEVETLEKPEEIVTDEAAIKETVSNFLRAKQRRNFDEAKPYLTPEFAKTIDPIEFAGISNPHTGRFEFKDTVIFSTILNAYEVKVRVYQEYTGEGEIGYNDDIFYLRQIEEEYLINNIKYGQYASIKGANEK